MAMFFNLQVMSDVSNDVTIEVNFNIFLYQYSSVLEGFDQHFQATIHFPRSSAADWPQQH